MIALGETYSPYREATDGYPAGYSSPTPRPGDTIYVVSTRCLPGGCGWESAVENAQVSQYVADQGWVSVDWETFVGSDSPGGITSVCVHGNRMDPGWARRRGWEMYHELTRNLSLEQNVRYVIWSWPTEQNGGALRSVREHVDRANTEAFYLGSYLATLPADEQVSLVAFSLGAKVVSGACHLLGGGDVYGRTLPPYQRNVHGYRVVYFSAAVTWSALCHGGLHGQALEVVDGMLNLFNRADKVLRYFQLATRRRHDEAGGYVGFSVPSEHRHKVEQWDASRTLGPEHSWDKVMRSRHLTQRARIYLQWQELAKKPAMEMAQR